MSEPTLRDRMITAINFITPDSGRHKWLEQRTGVDAQKWANLYNKRQKPTAELIEGLAGLMPQWTEWIVTGRAPVRFPQPPWGGVNYALNLVLEYDPWLRGKIYRRAYEQQILREKEMPGFEAHTKSLLKDKEPGMPQETTLQLLAKILGIDPTLDESITLNDVEKNGKSEDLTSGDKED